MHKILLVGAVISTLMLVQSKSEVAHKAEKTEQAQIAQAATNNNADLKKAFEQTQKDFIAHEHSSTLVKNAMKDIQLIPAEKDIKDFPAPLLAEENDTAKISAYYKTVADSYEKEAKKAQEEMTRAHAAVHKQKQHQGLKAQRVSGTEMPGHHDITSHKTLDSEGKPFMSATHTPTALHGDAQAMQDKRYSQLKTQHDKLEMKHKFYGEISKALAPKEAEVVKQ